MYEPIPIKRKSRFGSSFWDSYSYKLQRDVQLFGDLKYDHWILIETDPTILKYCERPNSVKLQKENLHSAFDMWLLARDGKESFVNIRYKNQNDVDNDRLNRWCKKSGYGYEILTEEQIRGQALYLKNMKWLLPYIGLRKTPIETDKQHILRVLGNELKTIGELQDIHSSIPTGRIREAVFYMIYTGELIATNIKEFELGILTEVKQNGSETFIG